MNPIEQRNVKSVRQQVKWLNSHDIDGFLSDLAPDFIWKSDVSPRPDVGIEGARKGLEQIYEVFPDIQFRELKIYPSGDSVIGVYHVSGTEIGERAGSLLPAVKDHPWQLDQAVIHTFDKNGKMSFIWLFTNVAALLQQLGLLPENLTTFGEPPEQAGAGASSDFFPNMGYREAHLGPQPPALWPKDTQYLASLLDVFSEFMWLPIRILCEIVECLDRGAGISDFYFSSSGNCPSEGWPPYGRFYSGRKRQSRPAADFDTGPGFWNKNAP